MERISILEWFRVKPHYWLEICIVNSRYQRELFFDDTFESLAQCERYTIFVYLDIKFVFSRFWNGTFCCIRLLIGKNSLCPYRIENLEDNNKNILREGFDE